MLCELLRPVRWLRPSLLGMVSLGRVLGVWPFVLLAGWALAIRLQEPAYFARHGVPFFWASNQVMLLLVVGLLPLIWRLSHGHDATVWTLRTTRNTVVQVMSTFFGLVGYGALLVIAALGFALALRYFTVRGILLPSLIDMLGLRHALLSSLGLLCITAALAPALAVLPGSTPAVVGTWLSVQALAVWRFGPWENSTPALASTLISGILSTVLATLGGLAVSLAHTHHRLRH